MRFAGTDFGLKYIEVSIGGETFVIQFRQSLMRGIYDVKVFPQTWGYDKEIKVGIVYPPLKTIIRQLRQIYIPFAVKRAIRKLRRLHNR